MAETDLDAGLERWAHPAVLLVATDLSDLDRLMPFALEQAGETGTRLILLHVLAAGTSVAMDAGGMPYYDPAGRPDAPSVPTLHPGPSRPWRSPRN
jgi:hypothetical protein